MLSEGSKTAFPVPLDAGTGTGVTTTVIVLVASGELLPSSEDADKEEDEDDCDDRWKNDSKKEERSPCDCRDCRSGVLLEDELEDVDEAGAVELVTICRLTCRGK